MDNTFYKQLCKEEALLLEKLRVLKEFKASFFQQLLDDAPDSQVKSSLPPNDISGIPNNSKKNKKIKKVYPKRTGETIPTKVKHALFLIGTGKTKDVADKMVELYDEYGANPSKAKIDARYYLSNLKQKGEIEVVEFGLGNSGSTYKVNG